MGLFPHWIISSDNQNQIEAGRHFIMNPPTPNNLGWVVHIDTSSLYKQWAVAAVATVVLVAIFKNKKPKVEQKQ